MACSPPPLRPRLTIPQSPQSPERALIRGSKSLHPLGHHSLDEATTPSSALLMSPAAMPAPNIHPILDTKTGTWTYIVADPVTEEAVIINPILGFNPTTNQISARYADSLLEIVESEGYIITYILETGVHRNHISACRYLRDKLARVSGRTPKVCIGRNLDKTRGDLSPEQSSPERVPVENNAFDKLFADTEKFCIGNIMGEVMYISTQTSELVAYLIGKNIFTSVPEGVTSLDEDSKQRLLSSSNHSGTEYRVYGVHSESQRDSWLDSGNGAAFVVLGDLIQQQERIKSGTKTCGSQTRPLSDEMGRGTPLPTSEARSRMEFYAIQINARGGKIPKKINLVAPTWDVSGKLKETTPRPLLIPRGLEGLLC